MSDKNIMVVIFSLLTGTAAYQLVSLKTPPVHVKSPVIQVVSSSPISVDDCLDCMESAPDSCEYQVNECTDTQDCSAWMSCVEDCVQLQGGQSCFDDCDVVHSDTHSECASLKSCMCDVCVGQCVDMCTADE